MVRPRLEAAFQACTALRPRAGPSAARIPRKASWAGSWGYRILDFFRPLPATQAYLRHERPHPRRSVLALLASLRKFADWQPVTLFLSFSLRKGRGIYRRMVKRGQNLVPRFCRRQPRNKPFPARATFAGRYRKSLFGEPQNSGGKPAAWLSRSFWPAAGFLSL